MAYTKKRAQPVLVKKKFIQHTYESMSLILINYTIAKYNPVLSIILSEL